jgi:LysR family hca operon transcriptional activator
MTSTFVFGLQLGNLSEYFDVVVGTMELRHLRYFVAVAEELNISRAAERLRTSQPSLGQQMRDLEAEIGVALFERAKNHFTLTSAGTVLLVQARTLLQSLESTLQMVHAAGRGEIGAIAIGSSPSGDIKVLSKLLPALHAEFPELDFEIRSWSNREDLITALLNRDVDVAFLRPPVSNAEIATTFLLREQFVVVLPSSHPLAEKTSLSLQDLRGLPFLANPPASLCPAIMEALISEGIDPFAHKVFWDTKNVMVDLNVIGSGLGFTLLPDYVQQIVPPTVTVRPLNCDPVPTIDLVAGFRRDNHSPALGYLLSLLRQCFPT